MTATDAQPVDVAEDEWRGRVTKNEDDELPIDESVSRVAARRARFWALAAAVRDAVALLTIVIVVENAARLSVPLLVQRGIDHGIPPIVDGAFSARELLLDRRRCCAAWCWFRPPAGCSSCGAVGPDRPGGAARVAPQDLSALPASRRRVPRPLHLGPGGGPLDQRRRGHPGHAGDRVRRPDHRRPDARRAPPVLLVVARRCGSA